MMLTDDALHAAMMRWLIVGPGQADASDATQGVPTKAETRAMYAERFPKNMDQFFKRKGKR